MRNSTTTVLIRITKISIKLDGLKELLAFLNVRWNVIPRHNVVVLNGTRVEPLDLNAI